eukprot:scaffold91_cov254-Pinguiococcus_pyrenoidosus.AAC.41
MGKTKSRIVVVYLPSARNEREGCKAAHGRYGILDCSWIFQRAQYLVCSDLRSDCYTSRLLSPLLQEEASALLPCVAHGFAWARGPAQPSGRGREQQQEQEEALRWKKLLCAYRTTESLLVRTSCAQQRDGSVRLRLSGPQVAFRERSIPR